MYPCPSIDIYVCILTKPIRIRYYTYGTFNILLIEANGEKKKNKCIIKINTYSFRDIVIAARVSTIRAVNFIVHGHILKACDKKRYSGEKL